MFWRGACAARLNAGRGLGYTPPAKCRPVDDMRSAVRRPTRGQPSLSLADTATVPIVGSTSRVATRELTVITAALALFLLWMPVQTPVALVVFQYGHSLTLARALLLFKDVAAAALILYLFARHWRRIRFHWFDWAAAAYAVLLVAYSVVPWLLGSHLSFLSVAASAREYVLPVELYALGRLAVAAGVDVRGLVRWFLAVSAVAAAFTVFEYAFLPATFWSSTMDMVSFVRIVQAVPGAQSLGAISILAQYGVGKVAIFPRAIGPFTHPVGTAHYFVLPLILSVAASYQALNSGRRKEAVWMAALAILFAAAVISPISRGSWIAAGLAVLACGLIYRRLLISIAALALTGVLLLSVRPFDYSITSAWNQTDSSTVGHTEAIGKGTQVVQKNPLGIGVGQADQFGQVFSGGEGGVGENMYLALLVSVGPFGFLAFLVFMAGLLWRLAAVRLRAPPPSWMVIGSGAALLGYAASAMFSSPLMRSTTSASAWLVIGLCVGLKLASSGAAKDSPSAAKEMGSLDASDAASSSSD